MRVLLTGFTPFGEYPTNPSQHIVEAMATRSLERLEVVTEVLPVAYCAAGERIGALIHDWQPAAVLLLGLAARRDAISLERVALNIDDAGVADNVGDIASGRLIAPDGPAAYWSSLPLAAIQQALQERTIPVTISNHAGTYVCNHVFYAARHTSEQTGSATPCGFIHVPAIAEPDDGPGLPLATMIAAVACCLAVLRDSGVS